VREFKTRFPAEWETHARTWLCWPSNEKDWPGVLEAAQSEFLFFARTVLSYEPLSLIIPPGSSGLRQMLREELGGSKFGLDIFELGTNRSWLRDSGPIFVERRTEEKVSLEATLWGFNAWAKYLDFELDQKVSSFISKETKCKVQEIRGVGSSDSKSLLVMEAGAIDSNGAGVILATEQCLLGNGLDGVSQVRNPGFEKSDYEEVFKFHLGVEKVIWLAGGIGGDDTHGHIDDVCRFVAPNKCLLVEPPKEDLEGQSFFELNKARLSKARLPSDQSLEVEILPSPEPRLYEGELLPASYANFYICNGAVLVPVFGCPEDDIACDTLSEAFPAHTIVPISSSSLILGLGSLHCLSLGVPAV